MLQTIKKGLSFVVLSVLSMHANYSYLESLPIHDVPILFPVFGCCKYTLKTQEKKLPKETQTISSYIKPELRMRQSVTCSSCEPGRRHTSKKVHFKEGSRALSARFTT